MTGDSMGQIVQRGYRVTASRQSRGGGTWHQLHVRSKQMNNDRTTFLVHKQVRASLQACVYLPQVLPLILFKGKKTIVCTFLFIYVYLKTLPVAQINYTALG
jgi:hypothetical protein